MSDLGHFKSGVKGRGGVTCVIGKGDSIYIGDDIEIIVQKNNSSGSKYIALRVIAPPDLKVKRSNWKPKVKNET